MISIEFGILIGIAINTSFVLYSIARPVINVYNRKVSISNLSYQSNSKNFLLIESHLKLNLKFSTFQIMNQEILILMPDQSLTFSSSDHFKYKALKYVVRNTPKIVIVDGRYVRTIDATVAKVYLSS